ncbi:MAG: TonB-dependent receptor [Parvularcula sp.]|jgi:TonB-dependent receptor|nr:TonB-dependent receptor [Parvularcula sp.]
MKRLTTTASTAALIASLVASAGLAAAQEDVAASPALDDIEDQIVVRGVFVPDEKQQTAEISSVLDADDFARAGDSDVAAAIQRVAGISVVDGKFPVARGLNERYSSATVNGVPLPSPEPLRRAIPLDIIPTKILAGSLAQKTFSPEYSGEFGGAAIDLRTASIPTDNFLELTASVSFDTVTSLRDGLFYEGSDTDRFGFDDGLRDLPSLANQEILTNTLGAGNRLSPEAAAQFENFDTLVIVNDNDVPVNGGGSATFGRVLVDTADMRIGNVSYVGFGRQFTNREGIQDRSFIQAGVFNTENEQDRLDYLETRQDTQFNALTSTGFEFGGDHQVDATAFILRSTLKRARAGFGSDQNEFGGDSIDEDRFEEDAPLREEFTEFVERQVWQAQLSGEHLFAGMGDLEAKWRVAYGEADRDAPYERNTLRQRTMLSAVIPETAPEDDREIFAYLPNIAANSIRFSELEDTNFYAGLDFTLPYVFGDIAGEIRAGGAYADNTRDTLLRVFRITPGGALGSDGLGPLLALRTDALYQDELFLNGLLQIQSATNFLLPDTTEASLETVAGYIMTDVELHEYLRFSIGGRYEESEQQTATFLSPNGGPAPSEIVPLDADYFLPAATITWNPVGNLQVRAGASKTITRPQFRELAGTEFLDPNLDIPLLGNPFLVNSEIINYDARAEWYFRRGEFLTVGGFYKDIDKPIERVFTQRESGVSTFVNSPSAIVYGAEVEFEKRFDLMNTRAAWLQNQEVIFIANYTYTQSEVDVDGEVILPQFSSGTVVPLVRDASIQLVADHSLEGQSDHLFNLQLGLEDTQTGQSLTALLNFASERTLLLGQAQQNGTDAVLEDPPVLLDVVYSRDFEFAGGQYGVSVKAQNLLGEEFNTFRRDANDRELPFTAFDRGRILSFSLSREF